MAEYQLESGTRDFGDIAYAQMPLINVNRGWKLFVGINLSCMRSAITKISRALPQMMLGHTAVPRHSIGGDKYDKASK